MYNLGIFKPSLITIPSRFQWKYYRNHVLTASLVKSLWDLYTGEWKSHEEPLAWDSLTMKGKGRSGA